MFLDISQDFDITLYGCCDIVHDTFDIFYGLFVLNFNAVNENLTTE